MEFCSWVEILVIFSSPTVVDVAAADSAQVQYYGNTKGHFFFSVFSSSSAEKKNKGNIPRRQPMATPIALPKCALTRVCHISACLGDKSGIGKPNREDIAST